MILNESPMEQQRQSIISDNNQRQVFEPSLDNFKDLYFRSHFQKVIDAVDVMDESRLSVTSYFSMQLYKIGALFEMHRVEEAHSLIRKLDKVCMEESAGPEYTHFLARLKYLDGDTTSARELWQELLNDTSAREYRFRALLGIANVMFSEKDYENMPAILSQLEALTDGISNDEALSYLILQGNYYWSSGANLEKAKQLFQKVMSEAVFLGWFYFFARAVYGLACVAQAQDNLTTLKVHLESLKAILEPSDNLLLKHLVNTRFQQTGHVASVDIEIDYDAKRVLVGGKWIDFHKTPLLFHFVAALYGSNTFVTKKDLALKLWPDENYKPRIHHPRIFNIAKRVRESIEAYESQPVILLSGRFGYKLAVRQS